MGDFATLDLADSGLRRESRVPEKCQIESYFDRFDATTLWFDAIWAKGKVWLICPRLNNFKSALKSGQILLDGKPVRPRFKTYRRHTEITLSAPNCPKEVEVQLDGWTGRTRVKPTDSETFAGRNVLITLSKDNELDWIEDWARFYVEQHKADAVLFVDNGSTTTTPEQIEAALRRGGFELVKVMTTPLRYGPKGAPPYANSELYLQTCVLNALRLGHLSTARAVLSLDIDELVSPQSQTIFDRAVESRFGYVRFRGRWVHMDPALEGMPHHGGHSFTLPDSDRCPPKWCIVPGGPLGMWYWCPHGLEKFAIDSFFVDKNWQHLHFFNLTSGWKVPGRLMSQPGIVFDQGVKKILSDAGLPVRSG
jgi:hypothetical protein